MSSQSDDTLTSLVQGLSTDDLKKLAKNIIPRLLIQREQNVQLAKIQALEPGEYAWISELDKGDIFSQIDEDVIKISCRDIVFEAEFPDWEELDYFKVMGLADTEKQSKLVQELDLDCIDDDFIRRHDKSLQFASLDSIGDDCNVEMGHPIYDYVKLPIWVFQRRKAEE